MIIRPMLGVIAANRRRAAAPPVEGAHRYWRLKVNEGVAPSEVIISTLKMRAVTGGTDLARTAAVIGTPNGDGDVNRGPAKAFDGDNSTFWQLSAPYVGAFVGCDFGSPVKIVEYSLITAVYPGYTVAGWDFQWSDDNATWTTVDTQAGKTWAANAEQVFPVLYAPPTDGTHRFWSVLVTQRSAANEIAVPEVAMRTDIGGANVALGKAYIGTPSNSGTQYGPEAAFDGNAETNWNIGASNPVSSPYAGVDFGSPVKIVEWAPETYNFPEYMPRGLSLRWSDNGTDWTVVDARPGLSWAYFERKTFVVPLPVVPGAHRYWRLKVNEGVTPSEVIISTLKMRAVTGGADLALGAVVIETPSGQGPGKAFDGSNNTYWYQPAPYAGDFVGIDFGSSPVAIVEYAMVTDVYPSLMPSAWDFQWSDDNATWTTVDTQAGKTWAVNVEQTFAVPAPGFIVVATGQRAAPDGSLEIAGYASSVYLEALATGIFTDLSQIGEVTSTPTGVDAVQGVMVRKATNEDASSTTLELLFSSKEKFTHARMRYDASDYTVALRYIGTVPQLGADLWHGIAPSNTTPVPPLPVGLTTVELMNNPQPVRVVNAESGYRSGSSNNVLSEVSGYVSAKWMAYALDGLITDLSEVGQLAVLPDGVDAFYGALLFTQKSTLTGEVASFQLSVAFSSAESFTHAKLSYLDKEYTLPLSFAGDNPNFGPNMWAGFLYDGIPIPPMLSGPVKVELINDAESA